MKSNRTTSIAIGVAAILTPLALVGLSRHNAPDVAPTPTVSATVQYAPDSGLQTMSPDEASARQLWSAMADTLPTCELEDEVNCVWLATENGNGVGLDVLTFQVDEDSIVVVYGDWHGAGTNDKSWTTETEEI